jgi:peptidoglycan hydrolase-like protein with peptidoglycan-binding domain
MLQTANPSNQPDKTGNNFPPATTTTPATTTPATTTPATTNRQSTAVTLPILREGMRGPAVAQLQERLRTLGFLRSSADGVFGEATQAAVIAAQERFKIKPDGIVGPATWRALLR